LICAGGSYLSATDNRIILVLIFSFVLINAPLFYPLSSASNWNKNDLGIPHSSSVVYGMTDVSVGDGDNDNINEIYFFSADTGSVYEYIYNNFILVNKSIGAISGGGVFFDGHVAVGDGDDDGKNEVYASGYYTTDGGASTGFSLCQFKNSGSDWIRTQLDMTGYSGDICVGDGNNDGKKELYVGSADGNIYEYVKKGTNWTKESIGEAPAFYHNHI
jgi:hypothetical protein